MIELSRAAEGGGHGTLRLDRTRSSLDPAVDVEDKSGPLPMPDGRVHLRVLLDRSAVEIFANGMPLTARVYPTLGGEHVSLAASEGTVRLLSLDAWTMAEIFDRRQAPLPLTQDHPPYFRPMPQNESELMEDSPCGFPPRTLYRGRWRLRSADRSRWPGAGAAAAAPASRPAPRRPAPSRKDEPGCGRPIHFSVPDNWKNDPQRPIYLDGRVPLLLPLQRRLHRRRRGHLVAPRDHTRPRRVPRPRRRDPEVQQRATATAGQDASSLTSETPRDTATAR